MRIRFILMNKFIAEPRQKEKTGVNKIVFEEEMWDGPLGSAAV